LYIAPPSVARWSIPSHPHSCPLLRPPPQPKQSRIGCRDVLRGRFVVIVDLKEGDIFRPILCVENEVCDRLVCLVRDDRSGGRRCLRLPSPNLAGSLLEHHRSSLGRMAGRGWCRFDKNNIFPPQVITSRPTAMRSSSRWSFTGLRMVSATIFDGRRNFRRTEQCAPSPRQSRALGLCHGRSIFCDV
jgi:hypothetical protein